MRVLLLTQVLPYPPDSGPKIKTYNVLKYLAQAHHVTLVSFVRGDKADEVAVLEQLCTGGVHTVPMERGAAQDGIAMARSLLTGKPWMMVRDDRTQMRQLVGELVGGRGFDVAHADQLNMAQYAEQVDGAFKVLDTHNALWLLYKRLWKTMAPGPRKMFLGRDWQLLKVYEGRMVREFDAVTAVSEEDRSALLEAADRPREITVIPIAIDTDAVSLVERVPNPNHILHIGTMYWPPNVDAVNWFIDYVYPIIREKRPDVHFDVVGSRPPRALKALNDAGRGINVLGYVADPRPLQRKAAVMVVPVRAGGGIRVKILNALAEGIPIVSTPMGCEGIEIVPQRDILVAEDPEAFASQVLRVLNDPALGRQLAQCGRRLVEHLYDYRNACRPLDGIYAQAAG